MREFSNPEDPTPGPPASIYRVRVAGRLPAGWEDRLGCLRVVHEEESGQLTKATLVGAVKDQSDLLGVLNTLHELQLPLLLVEALDLESIPPTRSGDSSCASVPTDRNGESSTGASSSMTSK